MKYTSIKDSDEKISTLGLGTWVFGGTFWGQSKERDSIKAVHAAIDHGINLIDTAPIYGNGRSEEVVGKAIVSKRDKVFIATKCGLIPEGKNLRNDLSAQSIKNEIEDSLRRLQVDVIDLYQCHWPDINTPIEETIHTLMELKDEGKIRYIGVSNYSSEQLKEAREIIEIFSIQDQYSLLEQELSDTLLPYCKDNDIHVLTYGALGGGILSGKYEEAPQLRGADVRKFFYKYYEGEKFQKVQVLLNELKEVGRPLNQVAINWVRQQQEVSCVLVGCRNEEQVSKNIEAVNWELEDDFVNRLKQVKV